MGFQDEYRKRFFHGDLTGPAKNFEQSVAFNAADKDRNRHLDADLAGDGGGSIDLFTRYSKKAILRALLFGIACAVTGALLGAGGAGAISIFFILAAWVLLISFTFMLGANLLKAGFLGLGTLFSDPVFWRGLAIGVFTGAFFALIGSGFMTGAMIGCGIYAAVKIIKHNNSDTPV